MSFSTRRKVFRIAHLTDLHLGIKEGDWADALLLVDDALEQGADHVVFSGDLLEAASGDCLRALVRQLRVRGLCDASKTTIVPGNHDVFPWSIEMFPWSIEKKWPGLDFLIPTRNFRTFGRLTSWSRRGEEAEPLFRNAAYPFGKRIAPGVDLVGLDTTAQEARNPLDTAWGRMDEEDADAAQTFFARRKSVHRVVVMHHYPFDDFSNVTFAMKGVAIKEFQMRFTEPDAATVRNWLGRAGATVVLCGHIHDYRNKETKEGVRVVCSNSSKSEGEDARCYSMVDLHADGRVGVKQRSLMMPG